MAKLNDCQKERLDAYMHTDEGSKKALTWFFLSTVGGICVSVGVGFLFGAAWGFLLVGAFMLAHGYSILCGIKKKVTADVEVDE